MLAGKDKTLITLGFERDFTDVPVRYQNPPPLPPPPLPPPPLPPSLASVPLPSLSLSLSLSSLSLSVPIYLCLSLSERERERERERECVCVCDMTCTTWYVRDCMHVHVSTRADMCVRHTSISIRCSSTSCEAPSVIRIRSLSLSRVRSHAPSLTLSGSLSFPFLLTGSLSLDRCSHKLWSACAVDATTARVRLSLKELWRARNRNRINATKGRARPASEGQRRECGLGKGARACWRGCLGRQGY